MKKFLLFVSFIILIILIIFIFSFKLFSVSGISMEPTLKDGDKIIVFKVAYLSGEPQRGDIILLKAEDKIWVKRIVGLPEEKIEIKDGEIKINDKILYESYLKEIHTYGDQRVFLGKEQFFVLGDNRAPNESVDSRIFGPISKKSVLGKAIGIYSPKLKIFKPPLYKIE